MTRDDSPTSSRAREHRHAPEADPPSTEATLAPLASERQPDWEQAQEAAWGEHTANAWALAHIIHRIYSTPLPPVLSPEQRRHFRAIIKQAASLIEAWQEREREQAQHLAAGRPAPIFEAVEAGDEAPNEPQEAPQPARHSARR